MRKPGLQPRDSGRRPIRLTPLALAMATAFGTAPLTLRAQAGNAATVAQAAPVTPVPVTPVPAAPAPAATPAPASSDAPDLGDVTVTATRRGQGVQDVPFNLLAVTDADIERRGLLELSDLARVVPGLFVVDQGGRDANLLVVRGLNTSSLGASEGVGNDMGGVMAQYVGDIPLFIDLHLLDIDRVEVLLGPQGTLYGAGTLGGAIRYIPNRPQFGETALSAKAGAYAMSQSSDFGTELSLTGNVPLGERTALRASFGWFDDPGFIDYDFLVREPGVSDPEPDLSDPAAVAANLRSEEDANTQETLTGHLALRHQFSDRVDANFAWYHQDEEAGARTVSHRESFGTGRYVSGHRFLEPNDRSNDLLSVELTADFGFATLTSATGWSRYEEDGARDQTDLLLDFEYGYEDFPSFAAFTRETVEEDRLNQELRLVSNDAGSRLSWIAGAFYNSADLEATSSEFVPGIPQFFGIDRPDNLEFFQATFDDFTERALFGELGWKFSDRWSATVGGRWFEFEDEQTVGFALPLIDGSAPDEIAPVFETVRVSDDDTIFKLNTSFQFTPDVLGYATLSGGYRTGGSNAVPACLDPLPPGQNVCALPNERLIAPDKTLSHELGVRSAWLDNRLVANAAIYYVAWDDIQVAGTTVNGAIPITVNAAEAKSAGVELSLRALLGDHWRLAGSYSYTQAELTRDAPGIVNGGDAFDGDRLPGSPEQQASLALSYLRPLGALMLDASYEVSAQDEVFTKVGLREDGEALGGYTLHNATVAVSSGSRWSVRLYARNLFDKYAETGVRNDRSFIRTIDGDADGDGTADHSFRLRRYYKSVLEPLRVGVTLTWNFDL